MLSSLQDHAKEAGQEIGLGIGTDQEGGECRYKLLAFSTIHDSRLSGLVSAFSAAGVVTQLYVFVRSSAYATAHQSHPPAQEP